MLLDEQVLQRDAAARALRRWIGGVILRAAAALGFAYSTWRMFSDDYEYDYDSGRLWAMAMQVLGLLAAFLETAGIWGYARAVERPRGPLRMLSWAFVAEAAISLIYFVASFARSSMESTATFYDVLSHLWTLAAMATAMGLVLAFIRMARLSDSFGTPIDPPVVWAAIGAATVRGLLIASSRLGVFSFTGTAHLIVRGAVTLVGAGAAIAVMVAHRRHIVAGADGSRGEAARPSAAGDLAASGEGLATYHGAIIAQVGWLVVGALVTFAVARSGDPESSKSLMVVVPLIAWIIQLVAIAALRRFARHLPPLHPARGAAGAALGATVLAALVGVVSLGLIIRALESGRLRHLFDLQDQLPVLQGLATAVGVAAALALVVAMERIGQSFGRADGRVGMLKVAIPALGLGAIVVEVAGRDLGEGLLFLGALLLMGALAVAAAFLGLVRGTADAMRYGG